MALDYVPDLSRNVAVATKNGPIPAQGRHIMACCVIESDTCLPFDIEKKTRIRFDDRGIV